MLFFPIKFGLSNFCPGSSIEYFIFGNGSGFGIKLSKSINKSTSFISLFCLLISLLLLSSIRQNKKNLPLQGVWASID